ncbi:MAG: CHAP domain-containing protein [Ruminococcus sp.]|nr:CHAP domain-containing protein [Ruminococcus sp.]
MGAYKPRLTRPEAGNKYYIRKASGGYSSAIVGSPRDAQNDVLHNCVGYAVGRFAEIGGPWLTPVNAELFIQYAKKQGLTIEQTPSLGACMVWQGGTTQQAGDGAGHVAIVEVINPDGSIITSESGYGASRPFWTQSRVKGTNGNWGEKPSKYKFLGFIKNPAVVDLPDGVRWIEVELGPTKELREVRAALIAGENYIRLRDFEDILKIADVEYNAATKRPVIID